MPTQCSEAVVATSDERSSPLFPSLGLPIGIRGVAFRNRIVQAPMCAMYANADGSATRQNVEYYRARAAGGAGLIIVEITFTDDAGSRAFHAQLGAHDDRMIPGLMDIAEAVRAEGAVPGLQFGHCGAQRVVSEPPVVAPSAIAWAPEKPVPTELTGEEIARIVQDHADATRRAVQAGFQLLELHAAHGYLVNTFLSPATNRRGDEYGGSIENRLRFPREVIAAMRTQLGPKRLLCARLNGDDLLPGGLTIDEYCKIAPALVEAGLDLIHVSAGTYRVMEKRIPPMYLAGETFAGYAGPIRRAAKVPVIASGTIHDPAEADRLIADGEADLVSLARPLFADPALPNKLLRNQPGEVLPCIRCNTCLGREQGGGRGYCAVNPRTGREFEPLTPVRSVKRIAVIGAGPAGIQSALSASERGHQVVLWEREDKIGGQVRLASALPFKPTLPRLLEYYETALERAGVVVRCGESPRVEGIDADVIVHAAGPIWDTLHALTREAAVPAVGAGDALLHLDKVRGRVLIVGAGLAGAELAWALALRGQQVFLIERDDDFDEDVNLIAKLVLSRELDKCGVHVHFNTQMVAARGDIATVSDKASARRELHVDTIVSTVRRAAALQTLDRPGVPRLVVGESRGTRGLLDATYSAYRAASSV
ncbi:MAG TPA: FAD-dependent oxidoreductase [Xanthobacteraceae bacterium]|jgi:2,4-dienoyl-CoA reductase-like NADH-dependent reductase (Old Yellow Enzyme family)